MMKEFSCTHNACHGDDFNTMLTDYACVKVAAVVCMILIFTAEFALAFAQLACIGFSLLSYSCAMKGRFLWW